MSLEEEAAFLEGYTKQAEQGHLIDIRDMAAAYEKKVGHRISCAQIYRVLHCHGWRKVMPRSKHPKKASEEVIETSKKLNPKSKKMKQVFNNSGKIRLMFQDEAGFGRINKPKYCWCKQGIRPSVPCYHIRLYRYVYGAVEPVTGEGFFRIMNDILNPQAMLGRTE